MGLSILALLTALIGTFSKLAPLIVDAVNRHYANQAITKEQTNDYTEAIAIASHDPQQSGPVLQRIADRVLQYKARRAALGGLKPPPSSGV